MVDAAELDAGQVVEGALDAAVGLVDYEEATAEDKDGLSEDTGGAAVITWSQRLWAHLFSFSSSYGSPRSSTIISAVHTLILMVSLRVGDMRASLHCYPAPVRESSEARCHANDTQPCYQKHSNAIAGRFVAV